MSTTSWRFAIYNCCGHLAIRAAKLGRASSDVILALSFETRPRHVPRDAKYNYSPYLFMLKLANTGSRLMDFGDP